jgi:hypothetical protein
MLNIKPVIAPIYGGRRKGEKKYPANVINATTTNRKIKMLILYPSK